MSTIRDKSSEPASRRYAGIDRNLIAWIFVGAITFACFLLREQLPWLIDFPAHLTLPFDEWINAAMEWFVEHFRWLFQAFSWLMSWPIDAIRWLLQSLPWPATITGIAVLAYVANGWRLAAFTVFAMLYMVVTGYWSESMNTLSMVFISIPLAVSVGFGLGAWAYKSERVKRVLQPALDLMQTVPTFAYLIPILLLFGFGSVVGIIASAIYACPPMVRSVMLGLSRVPSDIIESGEMAGATKSQLFWWVRVPTALPSIMIGVNQCTMAALSMVIIAAIIGSSADIGWEVLNMMRKAKFGPSLLSGIVIALIAMVMDRISRGFTDQQRFLHHHDSLLHRHRFMMIALVSMALITGLAQLVPILGNYPAEWVIYPSEPLNDGLTYVITNYPHVTDAIKRTALFYFLLPLRIGLETVISPYSWGFELTSLMSWSYAVAIVALAAAAGRFWSWRSTVAVILLGVVVYFGVTRVPWPAFLLVVTLLGWQVGGWRVCAFCLGGMLFMLFGGVWPQGMLSVYLCGAAVLVSFLLGGTIGIWASSNTRVSAFIRPINDTLQTMPLFVLLIPVLMFFQVGDFTAFLAIVMYAIVPAIRYTEHGLRGVRPDIIEAASSMGCTRAQVLWQVKLPLALPEIMLGLNQTIMYGLAMLVIAALVGTKGLGQAVYIALASADAGKGLVAGFSMAMIAMIADRIIQSWSHHKKIELGMT